MSEWGLTKTVSLGSCRMGSGTGKWKAYRTVSLGRRRMGNQAVSSLRRLCVALYECKGGPGLQSLSQGAFRSHRRLGGEWPATFSPGLQSCKPPTARMPRAPPIAQHGCAVPHRPPYAPTHMQARARTHTHTGTHTHTHTHTHKHARTHKETLRRMVGGAEEPLGGAIFSTSAT